MNFHWQLHVGIVWVELSFEIENSIHKKCRLNELGSSLIWIKLNFFSNYSLLIHNTFEILLITLNIVWYLFNVWTVLIFVLIQFNENAFSMLIYIWIVILWNYFSWNLHVVCLLTNLINGTNFSKSNICWIWWAFFNITVIFFAQIAVNKHSIFWLKYIQKYCDTIIYIRKNWQTCISMFSVMFL